MQSKYCDYYLCAAIAESVTATIDQLNAIRTTIEAAYDEGCPIARRSTEMASVALRRWQSSERSGVNQSDGDARIRDLAKGLAQRFEPDIKLVGPLMRDYEHVAGKIAQVL
jgi:hypothetical protein